MTEGKGEKLAKAYAYEFEKHCQGMTNLNENLKFSELQKWYYEEIAIHKLKPTTYAANRYLMDLYVMPFIGHLRIKDINTAKIDRLFNELFTNGRLAESYRLRMWTPSDGGAQAALTQNWTLHGYPPDSWHWGYGHQAQGREDRPGPGKEPR